MSQSVDDFGAVVGLGTEKVIGRVPALNEIIRLLKLQAGDPRTIDKAIAYEQLDITDAEAVTFARLRADTEAWSILYIQFSQPSGTGRYLTTGTPPTAAGFGMPILSGGAQLIIRGVDNINNFRMIAETGQTMEANALMFKAQAWREIAR